MYLTVIKILNSDESLTTSSFYTDDVIDIVQESSLPEFAPTKHLRLPNQDTVACIKRWTDSQTELMFTVKVPDTTKYYSVIHEYDDLETCSIKTFETSQQALTHEALFFKYFRTPGVRIHDHKDNTYELFGTQPYSQTYFSIHPIQTLAERQSDRLAQV